MCIRDSNKRTTTFNNNEYLSTEIIFAIEVLVTLSTFTIPENNKIVTINEANIPREAISEDLNLLPKMRSVNKIIKCSEKIVKDLPLILMSHAGPSGLGSNPNSICGKDWKEPSCDWGDRDLALAISEIQKKRKIDLVIFGHMHNRLKRNQGFRKMFQIDKEGTAYLNSAIVPRYKTNTKGELLVNFSWVEFIDNKLNHISHRWYSELGEICEEEILF